MLSSVSFVILAIIAILYSQGYVLDSGFHLSKKGGLYISAEDTGTEIFVNNKKKKMTGFLNNDIFIPSLDTGEYSVIIAKKGFWPWQKTLKVTEGYVTEARAFMVPQNTNASLLTKGMFSDIWSSPLQSIFLLKEKKNNGYSLAFYIPDQQKFLTESATSTKKLLSVEENISNIIWGDGYVIFNSDKGLVKAEFNLSSFSVSAKQHNEPTEKVSGFEKISPKGDEKILWDPNTNDIFVDWSKNSQTIPYYLCDTKDCQLPIKILHSITSIRAADFFPNRKDVIITAVSNGVYALEIDGRGGRLIQPIYKGKEPRFALLKGDENVYVLDEGALIKVSLEANE